MKLLNYKFNSENKVLIKAHKSYKDVKNDMMTSKVA